MSANDNERYEGIDRTVLDEDVWSDDACATTVICPKCSFVATVGVARCPRCNALLLTGCTGSCAGCGSKTCAGDQSR